MSDSCRISESAETSNQVSSERVGEQKALALMQRSPVQDDGARFWIGMLGPIQSARDTVLKPLKEIGVNLIDAWNLGDLIEDLKFRPR